MTSEIIYKGELRTDCTHLQSGTIIETDAPTDNKGKGERFSPTDLVATALGSCIITTMAIKTADWDIDLSGTKLEVTKIMNAEPRRIGEIKVDIYFPKNLNADDKQKTILERIAYTCPVAQSLHSDLVQTISFNY
ncbi:osmotically inducible protein OsmC [Arachidicoccus ginsenosidimutans]|uniref:OsmC family protein n=1 Tax=Arachidicoccus sp. BS20 TaxID=1850526 RepID=UPI0007F1387F|nr:OsmC family protein [Arachidicoccus sp. BS20]ANI90157.1 osmotically inducible protein OsmC [Arachidicoccus sp. BS20]